jgi:Rieske Fe-S protein
MHFKDTPSKIKPTAGKKIDQNRRAFIKTAALAGGAIVLTGTPLATYVVSPALTKGSGKWIDFGTAADLPENGFEMLSYEFMVKDGWLVLPQRGFIWARSEKGAQVKVFSSTCSHLACNVIWQQETGTFNCPCHSGRFNVDGRPISGPPTRPLKELKHKIEEDNLLVYLTI